MTALRPWLVPAALVTALLCLSVHAEAPAGTETRQSLADALEAYAKATGYQLVYRSDLTAGLTSNSVPPNTPPEEALRQLLAGTGLEFSFVNSRTIVIWKATEGTGRPNTAPGPAGRADSATNQEAGSHKASADSSGRRSRDASAGSPIIGTAAAPAG